MFKINMSYTIVLFFFQIVVAFCDDDAISAYIAYTNENGGKLVENLRRQLMRDNYDYEPLSDRSEILVLKRNKTDKEDDENSEMNPKTLAKEDLYIKYGDLDRQDQIKSFSDELNMRAVESKGTEFNSDARDSHGISKNDLLYYMDDDRLKTKMEQESTTAKYKVLKLKPAHPNRRSNSQRRLIQEESPDGITILTLDDDPLPPFQLPKTRRQYMQHHGAMDTEEELVPGVNE